MATDLGWMLDTQLRSGAAVHIPADNAAGLQLGRAVAHQAWAFYRERTGR